jgi:hypothetical protein
MRNVRQWRIDGCDNVERVKVTTGHPWSDMRETVGLEKGPEEKARCVS